MEVYIILALVAVFAMLFVGYWLGGKGEGWGSVADGGEPASTTGTAH